MDDFSICDICGAVVADQAAHTRVHGIEDELGPRIVEWLDGLDPEQVWNTALADAALGATPTDALFAELKRQAARL